MAEASSVASDALQTLTEQVFQNMKAATPALDELLRASKAYQTAMVQLNQAASAFVDSFGKVAVSASRARGSTHELGQAMQKLASEQKKLVGQRQEQAHKLLTQFVTPLQKRLKSEKSLHGKMEDDYSRTVKQFRSDIKKAGQSTIKAKKFATKHTLNHEKQEKMVHAMEALQHKTLSFEAYNQRALRDVMIEERRRYAYLTDNWASVFDIDFRIDESNFDLLKGAVTLTSHPDELPPASEALIAQNGSNGLMYEAPGGGLSVPKGSRGPSPSSRVPPSPLTQEFSSKLPPGCPPGGIDHDFEPHDEQVNPRLRKPTLAGSVPIDVVLAQQRAALSKSPPE